jgi:hypothetical protein
LHPFLFRAFYYLYFHLFGMAFIIMMVIPGNHPIR